MYLYSKSTKGFYNSEHQGLMLDDLVEIPDKYYQELFLGQAEGKQIVPDQSGYPIAVWPPEPTVTRETLIQGCASKRWEVETGGIVVGGRRVDTDRESQAQLNNSYSSLKLGLIEDTQWKDADGNFTLVTLVELEPIAQAVAQHVRSCFLAEQVHVELIMGITTQEQLDEYDINDGWPTNG